MPLISVGQLIDHSWEHFRKHFVEVMSISCLLFIPTIFGIISLAIYPNASTLLSERALTQSETFAVALWLINTGLITPIVGIFVFIGLVRLIRSQFEKTKISLNELFHIHFKMFSFEIWNFMSKFRVGHWLISLTTV